MQSLRAAPELPFKSKESSFHRVVQSPSHIDRTLTIINQPLFSAWLKVVAWDQPGATVATVDLGLPPAVVLVAEDGEVVALGEAELFGDDCLIHVQRAC
jgi:hypothetical protein